MKPGKHNKPHQKRTAVVELPPVTLPPAPPKPLPVRIRRPAWCLFSAIVFVFYFWTATSSIRPFHPRDTSGEFYNQLTTSFLKGNLYLDAKPAPQLLAMANPYDATANEPYRLHDASMYKGRYYVYFGVAPVVTLYLPWRVVTGKPLSEDVAVTLFCFGGYLLCCLLLFLLLDAANVRPPWWLLSAAVLALAVGQYAPIVLRRPRTYEVAVSAAYCFLSAALYFLARHILRPASRRWPLVLCGIALGLATASRPHCALAAGALVLIYGLYLYRHLKLRGPRWLAEFAPLLAPLAVSALLIGWYNFARFDNPLDFGIRYQIGLVNYAVPAPLPLRLRQVFASLYYLLLCLPNFKSRFPFLELNGGAQPFGSPDLYPEGFFHEPAGGLLGVAPLCLAALALPFILWRSHRFAAPLRFVLSALLICALLLFGVLCTIPGASGRYGLDFAPALLVAALFVCLSTSAAPIRALTLVACLWAAAVNLGASINSYGFPLERAPNQIFRKLAAFFGAGPDAVTEKIDSLHWEATVTFPHARPDSKETLLATGIYELWDLLFVQYVPGDQAMFAWVQCNVSDKWGPRVPIHPGTPQHLTADYSSATHRFTVRLEDAVVFDHPAPKLYPTARDAITVGTIRVGRFGVADFSGKLETKRLSVTPLR